MEMERRVGVAVDFSTCSKTALKWAVENVIRNGDHLILVNVQSEVNYEEGETQLWEATGSPFIPLSELSDADIVKRYGVNLDPEILSILNWAATKYEIVILMKVYWGDAREKLCAAIEDIPLSYLVTGSRGLGKIKRVILGSVSNYLVSHGSCPITVVKHSDHHD